MNAPPSEPYLPSEWKRRETLQWLLAMTLGSALPRVAHAAGFPTTPGASTAGYGTDPDLKEPKIPWPLLMSPQQLRQTAVLADIVLPASTTAPAASELLVQDFVNEWVSAPYDEQLRDRATIFAGLQWLDAESMRRQQRTFLECAAEIRLAIVTDIAQRNPEARFAGQSDFFRQIRFLIMSAYYTTPEGFRDIGYTGNVPLASYPPITAEERTILDGALAKLGLSTPGNLK